MRARSITTLFITTAAVLAAGAPLTAPPARSSETASFSSTVKLIDWDADAGIGSFKIKDKGFFVVQVDELSQIRVDKAVPAAKWQFLQKYGEKIHVFAEKDYYQEPGRCVGRLRPRVLVATGYAIEPLPEGERHVDGVIGILGWHTSADPDWKLPGYATMSDGIFDLGLHVREQVLVGTPGDRDDIKKKKSIHLLGESTEQTVHLSKGGRLLLDEKDLERHVGTTIEAPVIHAQRIVIPHKAFSKVYQYCFEETLFAGAEE